MTTLLADSPATTILPASPAPSVRALMPLGPRPPQVFTRGQGSWLWDSRGRRHLDLVQGWAVNTLGHAPAAIQRAVAAQAGTLLQAGPGFHNDRAAALAERLVALTGYDRVFIGSTGAEANEGAVKLARKWGQAHRGGASTIVTFDGSFHGRTLAMMAASGKPGFDRIFPPAIPGFLKLPFNDLDAVRDTLLARGHEVVALMLEPVQGEAGVVPADPAFARGLRAMCDAHGLLLIADEVQTGIGRCGSWLGHEAWGVPADIATLGKGLGGGMPVSAVLAREAVCCFAPGDQGGTYHGNALACAAALAVLDEVARPGFLASIQARGRRLAAGLAALSQRHGLDGVQGRGLLQALRLPPGFAAAADVADAAREPAEGDALLVNPAQPNRLRLMPALTISDTEIDLALSLLDTALARMAPAQQG